MPKQDHWESNIKVFKDCGFAKQECQEPIIEIDLQTQIKVSKMSEAMGKLEWLGYLVGAYNAEAALYNVNDLLIPQQTVTQNTVEVTEEVPLNGIIGTVHSHHTMGSFHSKTDEDFVASNHDVCLVHSTSGWKGKVRQRVPCGHEYLYDAVIVLSLPEGFDAAAFVSAGKAKISEKSWQVPATTPSPAPNTPAYNLAKWQGNKRQCDCCGELFLMANLAHLNVMGQPGWYCDKCMELVNMYGADVLNL